MYLFFSDLDGTLLDHDTYGYDQSLEGIQALREKRIPLVLVSSKTCGEMRLIHDELRLDAPFIFENGGGINWNNGDIDRLGMDVADLRELTGFLESALGMRVSYITDMDISEIVAVTGLSRERASLARDRIMSLPFMPTGSRKIESEVMTHINAQLAGRGVMITKGGRFFHFLSRSSDKGKAILRIIDRYRTGDNDTITTVGIGDSENDIPMLQAVDVPFIVRKIDGSVLRTGIRNIRETTGIGPAGFTEAVTAVIGSL